MFPSVCPVSGRSLNVGLDGIEGVCDPKRKGTIDGE
jgi:hypothetical protein